jgi:hypothetical protein
MSPRSLTPCLAVAAALLGQAAAHAAIPAAKSAPAASAAAADPLAQEAPLAPAAQPGTPQRSRMKACSADAKAKALHGDERRKFMSHCLSGKPAAQHS